MTTATTKPTGRGWAYACALLGGAVSVAANWAHSYVAPRNAPAGWTPEIGAVAFSVFWPIAVLAAVEAFARVPWPTGRRYEAIRFGGLLPVAVGAAVVSYLHLSGLLRHYGASVFEANFGPLVIDGLMLIGTGALIATSRSQQPAVAQVKTVVEAAPAPPVAAVETAATEPARPPAEVAARPATKPATARKKPPVKAATKRAVTPPPPAAEDRNDDALYAIIRPLVEGATDGPPSQRNAYNAIKEQTGRGAGYPKIAELIERAQREAQQPAKANGHAVPDLIHTIGN